MKTRIVATLVLLVLMFVLTLLALGTWALTGDHGAATAYCVVACGALVAALAVWNTGGNAW